MLGQKNTIHSGPANKKSNQFMLYGKVKFGGSSLVLFPLFFNTPNTREQCPRVFADWSMEFS